MQNPVFIDPLLFIRYSELASNLSLPDNIAKNVVDCKIQVLAILLRKKELFQAKYSHGIHYERPMLLCRCPLGICWKPQKRSQVEITQNKTAEL